MGKAKRMRQKLHNATQRSKSKEGQGQAASQSGDQEMMDATDLMPPPPPPADPTAIGARGENLFKDVKIGSVDLVRQKLPDFDAQSTITSKTFKGLNLKKKEKRKIRHDAWTAKIDHIKAAEKKAKEKKKKAQKARASLVGDLEPMLDALPTLELLMKSSPKDSNPVPSKARSTQKETKRKEQMLTDISLFQQVLKHPLFVEDQKRTITEHVKIALEKEAATTTAAT